MTKLYLLLALLALLVLPACSATEPFPTQAVGVESVNLVDENGDVVTLTIDVLSGALVNIEYEHAALHEGRMYTVLDLAELANGGVRDILIISPDTTQWAHMVWEIEHELETKIEFYRDTVYSDNGTGAGTPITSFNRNGNSTNEATTLVSHTANVTSAGVLVGTIQQGSGKKAGGSDRQSNEFILKQDCNYLIRITNMTANPNLIFMKLNWYEQISEG